jgi:hypothetical protein
MNADKATVELRPHIGIKNTPLGPTQVEHDQWIVVAAIGARPPQQVGYLNKRDGAPLLWLAGLRERVGTYFAELIEAATKEARAQLVGAREAAEDASE